MHFLRAGVAHHLHDLARGGAAHDGVVDQHDALAVDHRAVGASASCARPESRIACVGWMKVRPT